MIEYVGRGGEAGRHQGRCRLQGHIHCVPASSLLLFLEHTMHFPLQGLCTWPWLFLGIPPTHQPQSALTSFTPQPRGHLLWEASQITPAPRPPPSVVWPPCLSLLWFNPYSTSTTRWSISLAPLNSSGAGFGLFGSLHVPSFPKCTRHRGPQQFSVA